MKAVESIVSNMWVLQVELTHEGDMIEGHSHEFDHQHLLAVGEVDVTVDGETSRHKAPAMLFIEKGKCHSMKAVSDYTLGYCIHPIRNGNRVEDIVNPEDVAGVKIDSGKFLCKDAVEKFRKTFGEK